MAAMLSPRCALPIRRSCGTTGTIGIGSPLRALAWTAARSRVPRLSASVPTARLLLSVSMPSGRLRLKETGDGVLASSAPGEVKGRRSATVVIRCGPTFVVAYVAPRGLIWLTLRSAAVTMGLMPGH